MTELIVALDGPYPVRLAGYLYESGVTWFKIGPLSIISCTDFDVFRRGFTKSKLFLDLKLADTESTCREAVKRFAEAGIAAVSTFTDRATEASMRGAEGSDLRVWRVLRLTDSAEDIPSRVSQPPPIGHGVICSVADLGAHVTMSSDIDKVCPGVRRLRGDNYNGHTMVASPEAAVKAGASHIVVGQPIWRSDDPVKTAQEYLWILAEGKR